MKFKALKINDWKQFDTVDIKFHDRLTILTGANATGKTTLLNLLARHFGWDFQELSTPTVTEEREVKQYDVGEITYTDDRKTSITASLREGSVAYSLQFPDPGRVGGIYILSDRPEFLYTPVAEIPMVKNKRDASRLVISAHWARALAHPDSSSYEPPCYYIKEAVIAWGYGGFGSEVAVSTQEYKDAYLGFQEILKRVLPEELGFEKFSIRKWELVLITKSCEFMIDAVSGGIGALIDLAWQIYTFAENSSDPFTVLIDEVETHLHASMQRKLLPNFLDAFPNVQFIVSTHSPLVVSSVRDSSVYVLKYNDERRVESMALDITSKARDAADILRDVLGVSFTMPMWVENELNKINRKYSELEIDEETFASLRKELTEIGLEDLVPYSIDKILSSK